MIEVSVVDIVGTVFAAFMLGIGAALIVGLTIATFVRGKL